MLVDDPSGDLSLTPDEQEAERRRLFGILERLVKWENSNNPELLAEARAEIDRCFPDGPPPILDPFTGGGAIPLEAQRLGLTALAGDLNPVAVVINKAMIEIPPRFAGMPPVHPGIDRTLTTWERAQGLAADVLLRRSAVKARTVAANQIDALVVTAPERLQRRLRALPKTGLIKTCARLRPDPAQGPVDAAAKLALRALARRHQALSAEIDTLDTELRRLCEAANPALLGARGVGAETAATLLIAAGDNPQRMRSEASFASLCGTSPVEASSGPKVRHRLNRGGNRQANNALWRIAMVRLRVGQRTIDYAARRSTEGKTRRETLRCIKRHITREIYRLLTDPPEVPHRANLRQHRLQAGITITAAAHALDVAPARISTLETGHSHNTDLAQRYHHWLTQLPT